MNEFHKQRCIYEEREGVVSLDELSTVEISGKGKTVPHQGDVHLISTGMNQA